MAQVVPQSSICLVSRHKLLHVFPWIQCTGCVHNDHMVILLCECILCTLFGQCFGEANFTAHLVDVCIITRYYMRYMVTCTSVCCFVNPLPHWLIPFDHSVI